MLNRKINNVKVLKYAQVDKLVFTVSLMFIMPLLLHMLPRTGYYPIGAIWLPIFYAPLFAAIFFKKHVSIAACFVSPWINMYFTGMPRLEIASKLTFELIIFAIFAQIIFKSKSFYRFIGLISFIFAKLFLYLTVFFMSGHFELKNMFSEITLALPGIFVLLFIGIILIQIKESAAK
ncbi:MAG: hypothetical protein KKD07_01695 [Candidatus Omnitrophica bacterium]|nr:hypothetical protein [Candidatus Omnitrophota bacterium]MBU1996977.1 hypothetical protein [Candidatus Omnitrophota bacterium]MBU4333135.1 hypothetical protein [Candidatus Omnitrophota bacterium]